MNELDKLKVAADEALDRYCKLNEPAQKAYEEYEKANKLYQNALLYEKAKRQVMRDLISAAGKLAEIPENVPTS